MDDPNVIEMELGLPVPGVSYSSLKLRTARRLDPLAQDKGAEVRAAYDAMADELVAAHRRESARIIADLFPEKMSKPSPPSGDRRY
jgi:hypothetical protein